MQQKGECGPCSKFGFGVLLQSPDPDEFRNFFGHVPVQRYVYEDPIYRYFYRDMIGSIEGSIEKVLDPEKRMTSKI